MDKIDVESLEDVTLESLEEELAKIDPEVLRYFSQLLPENVPVVKKIIRNALEEPIPEETKKRLKPPLQPKPYKPIPPPRKRNRRQKIIRQFELLRQFDPIHPQNIRNEVADETNEGVEKIKGRRFIRWRFVRNLDQDLTTKFMEKSERT